MPSIEWLGTWMAGGVHARSSALILVVDDDVRSARLLARMLREDGFDVEVAIDGAAAVGRLGRSPAPDVLVTELQVPHVDGLALARFARSHRRTLPVMIVTNYPERVALPPDALDPAPTVFSKPLDYARLHGELQRFVIGTQPGTVGDVSVRQATSK
jgi:CheY-like chemotaxis protein